MYKCSNAGKVEYSDRPCPREKWSSRSLLMAARRPRIGQGRTCAYNAERARFDAQDRAEALNRASRAEAADAARAQAESDAAPRPPQSRPTRRSPPMAATVGIESRERK